MFASAFLILLFFSNSNLVDVTFVSGQSEKELLLELRNNLTYDASFSTKLMHWNESADFCGWAGVECDSNGRVSGLDLSWESISDGINGADSSLFRLTHLQSLSLAQNNFYLKEFPLGFGQLTELRYLNLSSSGFSGQIPSDLSKLTRLVFLDLSSFDLWLNNPDLRRLIHNYTSLEELYLDYVNISANGNEWGRAISSSLPNLRVLSMSSSFLTGPFDPSLGKLRFLSDIRLNDNNFSSPFPDFFTNFPNLKVLILSYCSLYGLLPHKLFRIKTMQTIVLKGNDDLGGLFPEFFPDNSSLQELVIGGRRFSGTLPESVGNLRMLSRLVVVDSNISGPIPSTIKNLKRLLELDLSQNQLSGPIPSFAMLKNLTIINLSGNRLTGQIQDSLWKGLENLSHLDLSGNYLEGEIPPSLFLLPALEVLALSMNSFSGTLKFPANGFSSLQTLDLRANRLEGPIPRMLFELRNLSALYLSWNKFSGSVELADFTKLTSLFSLDLSFNNLSVRVNEEASYATLLPNVHMLKLSSCKLQKLPNFRNQSSLWWLDLSINQLEGGIPNWLWEVGDGSRLVLNLSYNQFTHFQQPYDLRGVRILTLHQNMLSGQIPSPLSSVEFIDFSSNNFSSFPADIGDSLGLVLLFTAADNRITGVIPPSLCKASNLRVLDMSRNRFRGGIPSCLLENTNLTVLNLRGNSFDGDIPDSFPVGCSLRSLDLSRNNLRGKLPTSLTRCSELGVLDLTSNALDDAFPCWLKALSGLRVLVLRSNVFHGSISCLSDAKSWRKLHVLDVASNNISSGMPANMFRNLQGFMIDNTQKQQLSRSNDYYTLRIDYPDASVTVTMKGHEHDLVKIHTFFTLIDLSCNHLQGVIPEAIGELRSIHVLNLSHNALSGHIPSSVGNLKQLESLDLSFNSLRGGIPKELAGLTFLSALNLSYNHLAGRIPQGSQFRTFNESSFAGNEGLCGFPVRKNCSGDKGLLPAFPEEESSDSYSVGEIYASASWGFLVGLGIFVGPLLLWRRWRSYYSKLLTRIVLLLLRRQNHTRQR